MLTSLPGADGLQRRLPHGHIERQVPCGAMDLHRDPASTGCHLELHAAYAQTPNANFPLDIDITHTQ